MSKKRSGISSSLARMTVLPLLLFGIATTIFSFFWISSSMEAEVENELESLAASAVIALDTMYPGDYASYQDNASTLYVKGDTILNSNYSFFDSLKEETGIDYSLFYGDMRVMSTLYYDASQVAGSSQTGSDSSQVRLVGIPVNEKIAEAVINGQKSAFYTDVQFSDVKYYCYYQPIFNSDGSCVGMLAALLPANSVFKLTLRATLPILVLSLIAMFLGALWSSSYAKEFVHTIQRLNSSFAKAAKGNLSNTVPADVLARKDEFGSMAYSLIDMQAALREQVERDALTHLYNRRFGQQKLEELVTKTKGSSTSFSIALGDIDFFKKFNDTYGHDCGDLVLKTVAENLQNHVKDYGFCARWGGEEFLIVLSKGTFYKDHKKLMEDLVVRIRNMVVEYDHKNLSVTMSFGLIDTKPYADGDEMVKVVDNLLYYGKEHGRNRLVTLDDVPGADLDTILPAHLLAPTDGVQPEDLPELDVPHSPQATEDGVTLIEDLTDEEISRMLEIDNNS